MKSKILNIAHRGYSAAFPENTMLAFEEALKVGADGFEFDVRLSADGRVVLFHDDDLKRLCGREGQIETLTWDQIKSLRIFGKEPIPLLDDVLATFHETLMNIEIKMSSRDVIVVEAVMRLLTKHRPKGRILISSFSPEVLRCHHIMDPDRKNAELGILVETKSLNELPAFSAEVQANTWNVPKQVLNAPWQQRWGVEKIPPLWVWTVDEPDDWQRILSSALPFEAIITNKPNALNQFLCRLP